MYKWPFVIHWGSSNINGGASDTAISQLSEFGLPLVSCNSLNELSTHIGNSQYKGPVALVLVLDAQAQQASTAMALVKALNSQSKVLVLLNAQNEQEVINYVQAGANLYCDNSASSELLSALVWSLVGRSSVASTAPAVPQHDLQATIHESVAPPQPGVNSVGNQPYQAEQQVLVKSVRKPIIVHTGPWVFLSNGWTIMSPCQKEVKLTTVERQLFKKLMESPGYQATHKELLQAISDEEITVPSRKQLMNLSVVVSRIKRKAAKQGVNLPLESVHGTGYMFAPGDNGVISSSNI